VHVHVNELPGRNFSNLSSKFMVTSMLCCFLMHFMYLLHMLLHCFVTLLFMQMTLCSLLLQMLLLLFLSLMEQLYVICRRPSGAAWPLRGLSPLIRMIAQCTTHVIHTSASCHSSKGATLQKIEGCHPSFLLRHRLPHYFLLTIPLCPLNTTHCTYSTYISS